nr:MFS transporter [Novosphingobium sp. 32-60-15]
MILNWKARHTILSILFATWIVSYLDRMALSVAMPYIANDFELTSLQTGLLLSAFFASYSLAHIPGGMLADRFGVRKVTTVAMLWWSVFTAVTGAANNLVQMATARFVFGLGEGVFPPCAYKTISNWFPKRERTTANAIMLASNPFGAALSPLVVVAIMSVLGWRGVFYILCLPGLVIAFLFWKFVRNYPSQSTTISPAEVAEIEADDSKWSDTSAKEPSFADCFRQPNIMRYFAILFAFDIAYWGFATWLPTYLVKVRGFSMVQMGLAASLPFFAGALGSVVGGLLSDRIFSESRRIPLVAAQLVSAVLLLLMMKTESTTALIIVQTLAGFSLCFFISAFWGLPMNSVPKELMGVSGGFINMAGQVAAFVAPIAIGFLVDVGNGSFDYAFSLFIGAIALSFAFVVTLPTRTQRHAQPMQGLAD